LIDISNREYEIDTKMERVIKEMEEHYGEHGGWWREFLKKYLLSPFSLCHSPCELFRN